VVPFIEIRVILYIMGPLVLIVVHRYGPNLLHHALKKNSAPVAAVLVSDV
jgi:hypothetical protein